MKMMGTFEGLNLGDVIKTFKLKINYDSSI